LLINVNIAVLVGLWRAKQIQCHRPESTSTPTVPPLGPSGWNKQCRLINLSWLITSWTITDM